MQLEAARILITGGSLGIGRALAKAAASKGAKVVITGRDAARLTEAAADCGAFPVVSDVAEIDELERAFAAVDAELGGLDVLVNNAGIGYSAPLLETDPERMEQVWRVNVRGPLLMAQHACRRYFIPQQSGSIVNVASTAALRGYAGGSSYSSSKFALRSLSECWRAELRQHNIRVMNICPSEVTTAFGSEERLEREERANRLRAEEVAHCIIASLELDDRGFIPELSLFATNP